VIYTSPIDSISWDDLQEFCKQGIVENTYLDYKADFPDDLARTIAAMANTSGGVILVGVAETLDGRPVVPAAGIAHAKGLSERVTNIVIDSITPPVFPEVCVCIDESLDRAMILIRVPQSPEGPHAIKKNTRVYLRTGNRNSPETLASVDEVEWLRAKRAKSAALKGHLSQQAGSRAGALFALASESQSNPSASQPMLVLRVVPTYPAHSFVDPPALKKIFREIAVPDYYGTASSFPIGARGPVLVQDGAYMMATLDDDRGSRHYFTELSVFGQFYYQQIVSATYKDMTIVRASEIFCRLDEFARAAKRFYGAIGYQGYVSMMCSMYGTRQGRLAHWTPSETIESTSACPDKSIGFEDTFLVGDWAHESDRFILRASKTIGWAYDWEFPEGYLQMYYSKHRLAS